MKTEFCILTCLLLRPPHPGKNCRTVTATENAGRRSKEEVEDERKVEKAIGKLGGSALLSLRMG